MTTFLTFITATIAFFGFLNNSIKPEVRNRISRWLQNLKQTKHNDNWPKQFIEVFDTVFTKKHFSFLCFFRSCLMSIIWILVLTLVWYLIHPQQIKDFINDKEFEQRVLLLLPGVILVNLLADYISLLETRYMLKYLSKGYTKKRLLFTLLLDLVLTAIILIVITVPYFYFIYFKYFAPEIAPQGTIEYLFDRKSLAAAFSFDVLKEGWFSMSPLFYSILFTSAWLWIYVIAGFMIKIYYKFVKKFSITLNLFNIKEKPLLYIGFVAVLLESFIYLGYLISSRI